MSCFASKQEKIERVSGKQRDKYRGGDAWEFVAQGRNWVDENGVSLAVFLALLRRGAVSRLIKILLPFLFFLIGDRNGQFKQR